MSKFLFEIIGIIIFFTMWERLKMKSDNKSCIDCSWEFLNLVQQMVSSFQSWFVSNIPLICGVGLDDSCNFVDLAGQSPGGNKFREFFVHKISTDTKLVSHGFQSDSFVRFQELGINNNSGFSGEILGVCFQVLVNFHLVQNGNEAHKEFSISCVVKRLNVFLQFWLFDQANNGFWRVNDLFLQVSSV